MSRARMERRARAKRTARLFRRRPSEEQVVAAIPFVSAELHRAIAADRRRLRQERSELARRIVDAPTTYEIEAQLGAALADG